ncbi:MAG: hypothetical protein RLZZ387_976 [Chloroflexota bacterium]|jgi:hypothetical protein
MIIRVALGGAVLLIAALAAGVWLLLQPAASPFVVPGAAEVRVAEVGPGRRQITYTMTRPDDGWQTMVVRGLRRSGWEHKALDPWGETEDFIPTYTRTARVWFIRLDEEVQILGDREHALVNVERRFRLAR